MDYLLFSNILTAHALEKKFPAQMIFSLILASSFLNLFLQTANGITFNIASLGIGELDPLSKK